MSRHWLLSVVGLVLLGSPVAAAAPVPSRVPELVYLLEHGTPGERVIAAELLGDLGPAAADAAPALAKAALGVQYAVIDDEGNVTPHPSAGFLHDACIGALFEIGPKAAPALLGLLREPNGVDRGVLIRLRGGRLKLPGVLPALIGCLKHGGEISSLAAERLADLGPGAADAIPELVALFRREVTNPTYSPAPFTPQPRTAALQALLAIGPAAASAIKDQVVPVIVAEMKAGRAASPAYAAHLEWETVGEAGAPAVQVLVRAGFVAPLPWLGPAGRKAAAGLMTNPNPDIRRAAVRGLRDCPARMVAPFVPQLLAALKKEDRAEHRLNVVRVLARLGDEAPPEVVAAVAGLLEDRAFVDDLRAQRYQVADITYVLAEFGGAGVRALVAATRSGDPRVRSAAAWSLGQLRTRARAALPVLRELAAGDPDPAVVAPAAAAAFHISLDPADLTPLRTRGCYRRPDRGGDPELRLRIVNARAMLERAGALARLPQHFRDEFLPRSGGGLGWVPAATDAEVAVRLAGELKRDRGKDTRGLWWQIERCGPRAAGVVPALVEELRAETDPPYCAAAALEALGAIGPAAKGAVPAVAALLAKPDDDWRIPAAVCLGQIGPAAKDAVPALQKLRTEPNPAVRLAAAFALARIGGEMPGFRPVYERAVERYSRNGDISSLPANLFARLAPTTPDLIPAAVRLLRRAVTDEWTLLDALARYGPAAKAAVPVLRTFLTDRWALDDTRAEACRTLGAIGPAAREAVPDLRKLLDHPELVVALAARDAIRKIEAGK